MEPTYRSDDPRLEACALHEFSDAELREKLEYEKKRPQPNKARILAVEREVARREASRQVHHGDGQASAPPEPPQEPEADPDSAPWDLVERVAKAERERDKLQSALGDMQLDLHQARREKKEAERKRREAERQAEESLRKGGTEPGAQEPEPEPEPEPAPEALKDPLRSDEPLSHCEPIPDEAFEDLPDVLAEPTSWWSRRHKRDVFLTSALGILSGCLPNVHGWWGSDVPSAHGPNLFTCFVAGAAGGKSAGTYARGLAQSVHEQITERAERRIADWQARKKEHEADDDSEPFTEPRPPEQGLWVPANASYAQLLHTLHDNEERGIVFSSEIDTVADALGQDWGNFDSLFRKAYHHEADDQGRRETGNIRIEDPHVSLVLGGTDRQFVNLVGSAENGLYSRLCLYYFDAADGYRSQRPTRKGIDRANRLDALAGKVGRLWSDLDAREVPIKFQLEEHQWATLDGAVEPLHQETQRHGFSHLLSIPRRSGLWAFRIAMILTVLRAHVSGATLGRADTLTPTDEDLQAALTIASTYADHALRFGRARLEDGEHRSPKDLRISVMLANTDEKFTSRDAYTAARAEGIDVTDRTLRDDLRTAADRGLLERIASSGWRKR